MYMCVWAFRFLGCLVCECIVCAYLDLCVRLDLCLTCAFCVVCVVVCVSGAKKNCCVAFIRPLSPFRSRTRAITVDVCAAA